MLVRSIRLAAGQMFTPQFRSVLWKSLGWTIVLLIAAWLVLQQLVAIFLVPMLDSWPWVATSVQWLIGAGLLVGAGFVIAPVTAIFAGLFLDDIAECVERVSYPHDPPGQPLPMGPSIWLAVKFAFVVLAANLVALALVLLPGINMGVFFLVNGYLLGREYFQFAAMRFYGEREAEQLRKSHGGTVFVGGLAIAVFVAIPIVNLGTPIFAAALMMHLFKAIEADAAGPLSGRQQAPA